jgi:molybdate transport system regulatory protein
MRSFGPMTRVSIRLHFDNGSAIGPGKVQLLEQVAETGSIRKAATRMRMSYRKAWLLIDDLKTAFGAAVVTTATGGRSGGGAKLTPLGVSIVAQYRLLEARTARAIRPQIAVLEAATGQKAAGKAGKRTKPALEKN